MNKLRKTLSLILALMIAVSLLAACSDKGANSNENKKSEKKEEVEESSFDPKELLLGEWKADYTHGTKSDIPISIFFNKDGTFDFGFTEETYNEIVLRNAQFWLEELTDAEMEELFDAYDVSTPKELLGYLHNLLLQDRTYEDFIAEMGFETETGLWTLDGNKLTLDYFGETIVVDTGLSEGHCTFKIFFNDRELVVNKV